MSEEFFKWAEDTIKAREQEAVAAEELVKRKGDAARRHLDKARFHVDLVYADLEFEKALLAWENCEHPADEASPEWKRLEKAIKSAEIALENYNFAG